MTTLHVRFPWIVSFASALLFLGVAIVGTPIGSQIEQAANLPINSGIIIQQLFLVIFSALMVALFGGWRKAGFHHPLQFQALLLTLPMLVAPILLLFLSGISVVDPQQILMLVIFTAMIGFAEEALCRGVILGAFLKRGPFQAALISSVIFGSMHLINLFYGMDISTALLYVVYASLIGFGFAAPYIRSGGAIWPMIIVHALYDFLGKMGHNWGTQAQPTTSIDILVRLTVAVLVGIYGFWLLKQKRTLAEPVPSEPGSNSLSAA
ncbi:MAG: CPBP family intramembrane metalloprotease [Anaerolineaceae bacterium]|nr:CPBP family intramembrane metalloprotease [Anaerolineaceae bacterium]